MAGRGNAARGGGNAGRGAGRGQPPPPQQLHIVPQDLQDLIAGVGAAAANAARHTDWGKLLKEFREILKGDSCKPSSDFKTYGSTRISYQAYSELDIL